MYSRQPAVISSHEWETNRAALDVLKKQNLDTVSLLFLVSNCVVSHQMVAPSLTQRVVSTSPNGSKTSQNLSDVSLGLTLTTGNYDRLLQDFALRCGLPEIHQNFSNFSEGSPIQKTTNLPRPKSRHPEAYRPGAATAAERGWGLQWSAACKSLFLPRPKRRNPFQTGAPVV